MKLVARFYLEVLRTSSGDQTANLKSLQGITTWIIDEAEEMVDEDIFDKIDFSQLGKRDAKEQNCYDYEPLYKRALDISKIL